MVTCLCIGSAEKIATTAGRRIHARSRADFRPPGSARGLAEPSLNDTAGKDPLGLNTITLDRVLPRLVPGILQIAERARYFSIYPWMLWQFQERKRPPTPDQLDKFIRRREYELCLAMKLCDQCDVWSAIGAKKAGPRVTAGDDVFQRGVSIDTQKGGFGLYYRSPLTDFGAIAPVGTPLGEDQRPTPIEVLMREDERAEAVALAFHEAIKDTEYFKTYDKSTDPIPRPVLEELARSVCLCRLPDRHEERDAIRALMFEPASEYAIEACEARRRAFALLLSLMDGTPDVSDHDGDLWRSVIDRFLRDPTDESVMGRTVAGWAALAMKECAQDALCSIWTDFCRTGFQSQGLHGLTRAELGGMIRGLAGAGVEVGGSDLAPDPDDASEVLAAGAVEAAKEQGWEDVRDWAAEQDSAMAGLVALLILADRLPDPAGVHPLWREVAQQRSAHQDGLLDMLTLVRGRLATNPTVSELLGWVVQRFLIRTPRSDRVLEAAGGDVPLLLGGDGATALLLSGDRRPRPLQALGRSPQADIVAGAGRRLLGVRQKRRRAPYDRRSRVREGSSGIGARGIG